MSAEPINLNRKTLHSLVKLSQSSRHTETGRPSGMQGDRVYWQRETSISHLHLGSFLICLSLSSSSKERKCSDPFMPSLESKYLSVSLNCVHDRFRMSWQGCLLYFAQKPTFGGCVEVDLTSVVEVRVGCDTLCRVLVTTMELL